MLQLCCSYVAANRLMEQVKQGQRERERERQAREEREEEMERLNFFSAGAAGTQREGRRDGKVEDLSRLLFGVV
jgi:hypothetical protein